MARPCSTSLPCKNRIVSGDSAYWKRYFRERLKANDGFLWVTSNPREFPEHSENAAARLTLLLYLTELCGLQALYDAREVVLENGFSPRLHKDVQSAIERVERRMAKPRIEWQRERVEDIPGEGALGVGVAAAQVAALLFLGILDQAQREGLLLAYPERKNTFFFSSNQVRFGEATWLLKAASRRWIEILSR